MGAIGNARLQCHIPSYFGLEMNLPETIGTVVRAVPGALGLSRLWGL